MAMPDRAGMPTGWRAAVDLAEDVAGARGVRLDGTGRAVLGGGIRGHDVDAVDEQVAEGHVDPSGEAISLTGGPLGIWRTIFCKVIRTATFHLRESDMREK